MTNTNKEFNLFKKAELIGVVGGISFYENPLRGDEAPLMATDGDRYVIDSDFWDLPGFNEVMDWRINMDWTEIPY